LIATPRAPARPHGGRGYVKLDAVEVFVLDEADRMPRHGLHPRRQARGPRGSPVKTSDALSFRPRCRRRSPSCRGRILIDPRAHRGPSPQATTARERSSRRFITWRSATKARRCSRRCSRTRALDRRASSFTRHESTARIASSSRLDPRPASARRAIHGNKSQRGRAERALDGFKNGDIPVLIATDYRGRVASTSTASPTVVNYDLPNVPEQYVHRIGADRTAREPVGRAHRVLRRGRTRLAQRTSRRSSVSGSRSPIAIRAFRRALPLPERSTLEPWRAPTKRHDRPRTSLRNPIAKADTGHYTTIRQFLPPRDARPLPPPRARRRRRYRGGPSPDRKPERPRGGWRVPFAERNLNVQSQRKISVRRNGSGRSVSARKARKREDRKRDKEKQAGEALAGRNPDIAGIVPGPQAPPDW